MIPRCSQTTEGKSCLIAKAILMRGLRDLPRRCFELTVSIVVCVAIGAAVGAGIGDWTVGLIVGVSCAAIFSPVFPLRTKGS